MPIRDSASINSPLSRSKIYLAVVGILLLAAAGVAAGAAYYYYSRYQDFKLNPDKAAAQETRDLVAQVSKLLLLPTDEQPTVATVTDPERLKDQPFFAHAKKGYKVLIYTNARKAILYDPVNNKIIEVAPVNIGEAAGAGASPGPTPAPGTTKK